jgi:hypothetical protein
MSWFGGLQGWLSFSNYKVNYNCPLGSGNYGTVYEVVERPKREKRCCPVLFPLVYDYFYRVEEAGKKTTGLCIKIPNSSDKLLFSRLSDKDINAVLKKYDLTRVIFYKTCNIFSQLKTRVSGPTLSRCFHKFNQVKHYAMRKAFVVFLRKIEKAPIDFEDLHDKNIMYDLKKMRWEIVDGFVWELDRNDPPPKDKIEKLFFRLPAK